MFARRLGVGHGSLLWFTSTRTAFAPPGPGCLPVPRLLSSYVVLRLPRFLRPWLWSSLAFGLPRCGCLFFAAGACIPRTHRTSESDNRVSRTTGKFRGETWVSQATGAVLMSRVPWSYTPPGSLPSSPTSCGRRVVAFEQFSALGTRYVIDFVAAFPTAHVLARLRFAGRVTAPVARLATGSGGLTPGQAGFAPAGRLTRFLELITSFDPS